MKKSKIGSSVLCNEPRPFISHYVVDVYEVISLVTYKNSVTRGLSGFSTLTAQNWHKNTLGDTVVFVYHTCFHCNIT